MHRFKTRAAHLAPALYLALLALSSGCDSDVNCPEGFHKSGQLCLEDNREPVIAGEPDSAVPGGEPRVDASLDVGDSGQTDASTETPPAGDAAASDAAASDAADLGDASALDAAGSNDGSTPECDSTRPCSAGYACVNNSCASACATTQCEANATCGLRRGAPVCSCNAGYLPSNSSGRVTCVRDVACAELRCNVNATCELGSDQLRHCACKAEYTGDGITCSRISCPALTTLRIDNGRVSTSDGTTTVGKVATFRCNEGYRASGGEALVCDETGKWTGTPTTCSPIACPKPMAVEHATLMAPDQASYRPNQRATYACSTGYKPRGEPTITCRADGTWPAATLTCAAACGDGVVDRGAPYNEECDPGLDDLSAWTCDSQCKSCANGICKPSCATNACPTAPAYLDERCVAGECLLSCSTSGTERCPEATMCVAASGGQGTCRAAATQD
jgi:hypothetical protein